MQTTSQENSTFGTRLRQERSRLGYTQQRFAEIGGVSKTTVLGYESGAHLPGVDYVSALSRIGVDPVFVLLGVSSQEFAADRFNWGLAKQIGDLIENWAAARSRETPSDVRWHLLELFYRQFCGTGEIDDRSVDGTLKVASIGSQA